MSARAAPLWRDGDIICRRDLSRFRRLYIETLVEQQRGEIGRLELPVLKSLETGQIISQPVNDAPEEKTAFHDRMADRVATFGGSWTFIIFCAVLVDWMLLDATGWLFRPFDIYPFIPLNLLLSCVAALRAPVIVLHEKIDHQWERLAASQQIQIELLEERDERPWRSAASPAGRIAAAAPVRAELDGFCRPASEVTMVPLVQVPR